jgi:hypothetical protein
MCFHGEIKTKKDLSELCETLKKSPAYQKIIKKSESMNKALKIFYGLKGEAKTFKGWKKEGYLVKKGEKAYTFWSRPRISRKNIEMVNTKTNKKEKVEEDGFKYYGICKLFTENQVQGLEIEK